MVSEFFNRSVGPVYRIGGPTHYESVLPTSPLVVSADRTLAEARGHPVVAEYVLVPCRTHVAGAVVAMPRGSQVQLVRVDPPLRVVARTAVGTHVCLVSPAAEERR
jgi:hypothetical protein